MKKKEIIELLRRMPPHSHWPNKPAPFDIMDSRLACWLVEQPEILEWVVERAKDSGAIAYDPDSRTWSGVGDGPLERRQRSQRFTAQKY